MYTVLWTLTFTHARLGRAAYWLTLVGLHIANFILIPLIATTAEQPLWVPFITVWAITAYVWLAVSRARLRDMGASPMMLAFMILPIIGFFLMVWIGFAGKDSFMDEEIPVSPNPPKI